MDKTTHAQQPDTGGEKFLINGKPVRGLSEGELKKFQFEAQVRLTNARNDLFKAIQNIDAFTTMLGVVMYEMERRAASILVVPAIPEMATPQPTPGESVVIEV